MSPLFLQVVYIPCVVNCVYLVIICWVFILEKYSWGLEARFEDVDNFTRERTCMAAEKMKTGYDTKATLWNPFPSNLGFSDAKTK